MLPRIVVPNYDLVLPTSGKKVKYRPFLVKEEKIMLLAAASREPADIKNSLVQVISNCVIEPKNFKVLDQAVVDIQWILLNLRIRSIGKSIETEYTCNATIPDSDTPCGNQFVIKYNLEDVAVVKDAEIKPEIWLTPEMGVRLRPPAFKVVTFSPGADNFILEDAIEAVFDHKQSYSFQDETLEARTAWLEELPRVQYDKLVDYLSRLPKFEVNKDHTCEKCGTVHHIKIKDVASFF